MSLHHDPLWPRAGAWTSDAKSVDFGIIGVPTYSTSITPGTTHLTPAAVRAVIPRYSEMSFGPNGARNADSLERADFGDIVDPDGNEIGAIEAIRAASARSPMVRSSVTMEACPGSASSETVSTSETCRRSSAQ